MEINFSSRECNVKIVYYGPGLSGKTTNLQVIHAKTPEDNRGKLIALSTDQDRTLFFDYMPLDLGEIGGLKIRLRLYTVPGQVYYNATRKLVLRCVDGIVFVADSQENKRDENIESFENMKANLQEQGFDLHDIPLVIQYNKRDLPGALPLEAMEEMFSLDYKVPSFPAVAPKGDGVFQCLKSIANLSMTKVEENIRSRSKAKTVTKEKEPSAKIEEKRKNTGMLLAPHLRKTDAIPLLPSQKKSDSIASSSTGKIQFSLGQSMPKAREEEKTGNITSRMAISPPMGQRGEISPPTGKLPGESTPYLGEKKVTMPTRSTLSEGAEDIPKFSLGYKMGSEGAITPPQGSKMPHPPSLQGINPKTGATPPVGSEIQRPTPPIGIAPGQKLSSGHTPSAGTFPVRKFGSGITPPTGIAPVPKFAPGATPPTGIAPVPKFAPGATPPTGIKPLSDAPRFSFSQGKEGPKPKAPLFQGTLSQEEEARKRSIFFKKEEKPE